MGGVRRHGASRLSRRQGASLSRCVAAGGRGSGPKTAVSVSSRMGVQALFAHARPARSVQAQLPIKRGGKLVEGLAEERTLGARPRWRHPPMLIGRVPIF
ncbi:hypothetical protein NDU88_000448 [Pleurodeles waltl]|uniref:Uncharacterized protein n=1 Tax=Pleurodeles waltl TaxID=8319 RepID=A0AAV7VXE2_PLEWA|nr:hypothetical protein NDU88_000448 [Pleurodeles waltl]